MMNKTMLNRTMAAALLGAAAFAPLASQAQVYVRVGPPRPIVERRPPPPRPGYVWHGGYHRWDGRGYVWVPGSYYAPPRPGAVWVNGAWVHNSHGYYYRDGRWR
jgi:hypothetical protein